MCIRDRFTCASCKAHSGRGPYACKLSRAFESYIACQLRSQHCSTLFTIVVSNPPIVSNSPIWEGLVAEKRSFLFSRSLRQTSIVSCTDWSSCSKLTSVAAQPASEIQQHKFPWNSLSLQQETTASPQVKMTSVLSCRVVDEQDMSAKKPARSSTHVVKGEKYASRVLLSRRSVLAPTRPKNTFGRVSHAR